MEIKEVKVVDLYEWDELVVRTYGKIYELQQQEGCYGRGTLKITVPDDEYEEEDYFESIPEVINGSKMGVKFDVWLNRDPNAPLNPTDEELEKCPYFYEDDRDEWCKDKSNIRLFWKRNFYPSLQTLANDLHKKGLIEEGDYMIDIDW